MSRRQLFWAWVVVLTITHGANAYAVPQKLFWTTWWIDIPFHLAGGLGVGFFALWLGALMGLVPLKDTHSAHAWGTHITFSPRVPWWWSFGLVLGIVTVIGLAWEVFEVFLMAHFAQPIPNGYVADTVKDLCNDVIGATVAWAAFYRLQWKAWQGAKAFEAIRQN